MSHLSLSVCHLIPTSSQSPVDPTSTVWWLLWIKDHIKYQDTGTSLLSEANWTTYYRASSEASGKGVTQGSLPLRLLLAVYELSDLLFHLVLVGSLLLAFHSPLSPLLLLYFLLFSFHLRCLVRNESLAKRSVKDS